MSLVSFFCEYALLKLLIPAMADSAAIVYLGIDLMLGLETAEINNDCGDTQFIPVCVAFCSVVFLTDKGSGGGGIGGGLSGI